MRVRELQRQPLRINPRDYDDRPSLDLDFVNQRYMLRNVETGEITRPAFADLFDFGRASGGGCFNSSGEYEWLAPSTTRFDHDPVTGESLGVLIEPQRVNMIANSVDIAAWGVATGELSISQGWFELTRTMAGGSTTATQVIGSCVDGRTYTASVDIQDGSLPLGITFREFRTEGWQEIAVDGNGDQFGSISPGASYGGKVKIPGGWRVWVSCVANRSNTAAIEFRINAGSAAEIGDFVRFKNPQVEEASAPTSYIPTSGSQITRASDAAFSLPLGSWAAPEGTIICEFDTAADAIAYPVSVSTLSPTTAPRISMRISQERTFAGQILLSNGSVQANISTLQPVIQPFEKNVGVFSFKKDQFFCAVNDGGFDSDLSGNVPADATTVYLGHSGLLNGHIRRLKYIPRAVSRAGVMWRSV